MPLLPRLATLLRVGPDQAPPSPSTAAEPLELRDRLPNNVKFLFTINLINLSKARF